MESEFGLTNLNSGAKIAPASPVKAADKAKAAVLTITGLSPIDRAATSGVTHRDHAPAPGAVGEAVEEVE